MTKIHLKSVRKDLENRLEVYSVLEVSEDCKRVLKELNEYPESNKWELNYYKKFWLLLSEY